MAKGKGRDSVNVSIIELKILSLLARSSTGLFASQIVHQSEGFVKRGTVYVAMRRLEKKNLVTWSIVPASPEYNLDRYVYIISTNGESAIRLFADVLGLKWKK